MEVLEAISVLKNKDGNNNLTNLCIELASEMVSMGKNIGYEEAKKLVIENIDNGKAYNKFLEMVKCQGGDIDSLSVSNSKQEIFADRDGIVKNIDALKLGKLSVSLGAGRESKEDKIDYSVGIYLNKLVGDKVAKGDVIATIYKKDSDSNRDFDGIFTIN